MTISTLQWERLASQSLSGTLSILNYPLFFPAPIYTWHIVDQFHVKCFIRCQTYPPHPTVNDPPHCKWLPTRKWKEEQAEEIAARDADSARQKEDWKEAAKRELENWYTKQNDVLDKNKTGNR